MSSEREDETATRAEGEEAGVLGNLPRSRPSVRSPRRERPSPRPAEPRQAPAATTAPETRRGAEAELEALARSGISLAGAVTGLGLRAAGRAAAALRGAIERR